MTKRPARPVAIVAGADSEAGVYGISVAAEISGVAVQSLRLWERHGLLAPSRSAGGTRRYSRADLVRVARILELEDDNATLRAAMLRRPR